jgi:hypothetical protein
MDVTGGAIASGDEGGLPGKSGADGAPEVLGLGWMRRTEEQEQSHSSSVCCRWLAPGASVVSFTHPQPRVGVTFIIQVTDEVT